MCFTLSLRLRFVSLAFALACVFAGSSIAAEPSVPWPEITREQKPWTRWWWLGSAVDKANLTRELEEIAAAGFGGVEITPIYGAKGFEDRYLSFLSPPYMEMLAYTCSEARRLGLAVDMATGTGWPFGGKNVSREDAELKIEIADGKFAPLATRFKVKRAAPGAEGWVLNPFSPAAMSHYLDTFSGPLETLPVGALHGQFHDSFEYTANWSNEVPARFEALHHYRLEDQIDAFSGKGDPDTVARVKSDYRETLAALHLEYVATWIGWTHAHGQIARNQAHGAPANLLDLYAQADIPETEVFGGSSFAIPGYRFLQAELSRNEPQPLVNRFASSAAHVAGRPLVSSETFTWLREHFHEAPSEMKPELDQLFLTGINHIFYHGTAYSPSDAQWPGWLFYASTQFNPRNPLWRDFRSLNTYIARCQSLLQAGQPDNDFLVYWPVHDLWHRAEGWNRNFSMHGKDWLTDSSTGSLARELLAQGYSFDFISDTQLQQTRVLERLLQTPGARYRAVIVPQARFMPAATLERLLSLAGQGATILFVGELPTDVPGLGQLEQRRTQFHRLLKTIVWSERSEFQEATVGRGKLVRSAKLTTALAQSAVPAEVAIIQGLSLLRRNVGGSALYFLANLSNKPIDGWVHFSKPAKAALLLDPRTGRAGQAVIAEKEAGTDVFLQLQPGESLFAQFQSHSKTESPAWPYRNEAAPAVRLAGEWKIRFLSGGPDLPAAFTSSDLKSWTAQGGVAEVFGGTAAYELSFDLPATIQADDWLLDLGDVRETARVFLNDTEIDHLWSLPFHTRIGPAVKPGLNLLRVEVTNLAANRIRDLDIRKVPWKNFHEINLVNAHYQKLDASTWPLQDSGLLGPVRLIPLQSTPAPGN